MVFIRIVTLRTHQHVPGGVKYLEICDAHVKAVSDAIFVQWLRNVTAGPTQLEKNVFVRDEVNEKVSVRSAVSLMLPRIETATRSSGFAGVDRLTALAEAAELQTILFYRNERSCP